MKHDLRFKEALALIEPNFKKRVELQRVIASKIWPNSKTKSQICLMQQLLNNKRGANIFIINIFIDYCKISFDYLKGI